MALDASKVPAHTQSNHVAQLRKRSLRLLYIQAVGGAL